MVRGVCGAGVCGAGGVERGCVERRCAPISSLPQISSARVNRVLPRSERSWELRGGYTGTFQKEFPVDVFPDPLV